MLKHTVAVPQTSATRTSCWRVRAPAHAVSGTLASATADTRSHAIISGRLRIRSTHAPTGSPTSSQGSHTAAAIRPTAVESASSTTTAISGRATTVMLLPSPLTVSPSQSRRKSGRANTPRRVRGRSGMSFIASTRGIMPLPTAGSQRRERPPANSHAESGGSHREFLPHGHVRRVVPVGAALRRVERVVTYAAVHVSALFAVRIKRCRSGGRRLRAACRGLPVDGAERDGAGA